MGDARKVRESWKSRPTLEGAGVHLKRAFGNAEVPRFDPFLMLDDFGGDDPARYVRGFPWHPHRGIETISYVLRGEVEHEDSLGNHGVIGAGEVQWMTAGSGIIHQEMPVGDARGRLRGLQLWSNLPAANKMMAPRYQDVKASAIPVVPRQDGVCVRVVCGEVDGVRGPVRDIVSDPQLLDVTIPAGVAFRHPVPRDYNVFAYVLEGAGRFDCGAGASLAAETLVGFGDGDEIAAVGDAGPVRFILASGRPIGEPVAWKGPIVMNTQAELETAFRELEEGTFVKGEPVKEPQSGRGRG